MWILFASIAALSAGTKNILSKVSVSKLNEYVTMMAIPLFSLLVSTPLVLITGFVVSDPTFWKIMALRVFIDVIAYIAFIKALKLKTVSYVIPLISFNPVLTSITAFFINGQRLSFTGLLGIMIICSGNLLLFANEIDFKNVKNNGQLVKATLLILVTIVGWAIVDPIHKVGIGLSSPFTYQFVGSICFAVIFSTIAFVKARGEIKKLFRKEHLFPTGSIGILQGIEFGTQLMALTTGLTAYVSAIKSLHIGVSSLLAFKYLKEEVSLMKILAIVLGIVGVVVLALSK